MAKKKSRKNRKKRVFILIIALFFTTVLFATTTYAWFTANKTVRVERLTVNVEAQNGIQISTDAVNWKALIQKQDIINAVTLYSNAVNQVPTTMEPVSTVGTIDNDGHLEMFYGEVTSDDGGNYVLKASKETETNSTADAAPGKYIAFDLFFKVTAESPLKMTKNSGVTLEDGYVNGIQNAARMGFVILGNKPSSTAYTELQAMGTYDPDGGEADTRTRYIWEPNYDVHTGAAVQHALVNYNQATTVGPGADRLKYQGVKAVIPANTPALVRTDMSADSEHTYVDDYPAFFGDVEPEYKTVAGFTQEFGIFTLQPGVTKVRVYMWIEGQDVDCENDASGGKINFDIEITTPTENTEQSNP